MMSPVNNEFKMASGKCAFLDLAACAKMRDCSRFMAWNYTYCQNGGHRVLIKNRGHNFG
jgi:DNA-directed RNA polymerase subunit RPC12/RpoP